MRHQLRISVLISPNVPWAEFVRRCCHVEELGFDGVCFADHFTDYRGAKGARGPWFEMWSLLSAVAMATTRIRLQTLVAQVPFRNPALFALQALTADHISIGRLDVGLGCGTQHDLSYQMMGIENWGAKERVARFGEYVQIVERLLSQEETSYRGRYYQVEAAALFPRPVQLPRPPLVIAAMGPVMLGHAARYADIWNCMSYAQTFGEQLSETRRRVAAMDVRCSSVGRDPASLRRSYFMLDMTRRLRGGAILDYELEEIFTKMAQQLIALGISELVVMYPWVDHQIPMLERIARNTLPALRAAHIV